MAQSAGRTEVTPVEHPKGTRFNWAGRTGKDRGRKSEGRDREKTEDRGQKSDVGDREKTEDRGQKSEDRGRKSEDRGRKSEDRGRKTEDGAAEGRH
ncbi:MAG: hypothetical protein U9N58_06875 [Thermodesulfobacteriota bacterium]|nr:hypothetical protein [Thermodesulfobacteriota bacterium]